MVDIQLTEDKMRLNANVLNSNTCRSISEVIWSTSFYIC